MVSSSTGGPGQKIALDHQLANFGVELGNLGLASVLPLTGFVVEDARELLDGLLLPEPDQVRVQGMPACQLGNGVLALDGLQGHLGLELSRISPLTKSLLRDQPTT